MESVVYPQPRKAAVSYGEIRVVIAQPGMDAELAKAILSLQHRAYSVEAAVIGDDRIPHLHETADQLSEAAVEWFIALTHDGDLVGALAWVRAGDAVDIDRLVVEPSMHRRGIGATLVRTVLDNAGEKPVTVATATGNTPARALYDTLGFTVMAEEEVLSGLWVTRYVLAAPFRRIS